MLQAAMRYLFIGVLAVLGHLPVHAQAETSSTEREAKHAAEIQRRIVQARERTLTTGTAAVVASNLPLSRVVREIKGQSGTSVRVHGGAGERRVNLLAGNPQPVKDLLNELASVNPGLIVKASDEGFEIWDEDGYNKEARETVVYALQVARASDVEQAISKLVATRSGTVIRDDRLNKLIINDVPEGHIETARIIKELDQGPVTEAFHLKYAQAKAIAAQLTSFLSLPRNAVASDSRTGQVVVQGTATDIERARNLVRTFDVPSADDPKTGRAGSPLP